MGSISSLPGYKRGKAGMSQEEALPLARAASITRAAVKKAYPRKAKKQPTLFPSKKARKMRKKVF